MKNSQLDKKQKKARIRSMVSKVHILIAVVAIIECLVLISFTTYSWIETASSLIIKTGHKYYDDTFDTRIPISKALNYKFIVGSDTPNMNNASDLNSYFSLSGQSSTQNLFRFARASSANGKDFFFPKKTNLKPNVAQYRKGDIIDSNSNYVHYDFTVSNTDASKTHKLKFYFQDANVFTVSNGTSTLTDTQLQNIQEAMRISFQTGQGTPKIYAMSSGATDTFNSTAVNNVSGATQNVTVTKIKADANQKLFTIGKDSEQNVSVRIWLENKSTGIEALTSAELSGVNIAINLKLTYAQNDYDYLYFDDYTFSSGKLNKDNIGGHLTEDYDESDNYRMYFVYRTANSTTGFVYPMTRDASGSNVDANCWVTCDANGTAASSVPDITGQLFITNLITENHAALTYSYFAYGKCALSAVNTSVTLSSATTALYKWELNYAGKASGDGELRYNAYSVTNTASGAENTYGVGGWSYNTPLSMVYFRDRATGVTSNAFNSGDNFQYITNAVNAASDVSTGNRSDVMYVNAGEVALTDENKATQAPETVTMYFDKSLDNGEGLFKSWVPASWLDAPMRFNYCPDGFLSNCCVSWYTTKPSKPVTANDYVYTALGYSENYEVSYYSGSLHGSGTWNEIMSTPVNFSTELIDNVVTGSLRYQIGVKLEGDDTYSFYHLIPDETNMLFYAYLPKAGTNANPLADYANNADISFRSFSTYNAGTDSINGLWYTMPRKGSNTYYPVKMISTNPASDYTRGYWNISVIVDGTYEHFFWDYGDVSDLTDDNVLGTFSYNTTGHSGTPTYTDITPNKLDEYRWYIPLDNLATIPEYVYYKWEPYTGTVFKYSQKLSDGIYCVITEAPDNTPANAFD